MIVFGASLAFLISLLFFLNSMSDYSNLVVGGRSLVVDGQLTARGYFSCLVRALLSTIVGVAVAQICFRAFERR